MCEWSGPSCVVCCIASSVRVSTCADQLMRWTSSPTSYGATKKLKSCWLVSFCITHRFWPMKGLLKTLINAYHIGVCKGTDEIFTYFLEIWHKFFIKNRSSVFAKRIWKELDLYERIWFVEPKRLSFEFSNINLLVMSTCYQGVEVK